MTSWPFKHFPRQHFFNSSSPLPSLYVFFFPLDSVVQFISPGNVNVVDFRFKSEAGFSRTRR